MVVDVEQLIAAMGIPSAITGFCFWLLERRMQRREKERERREEERRRAADRETAERRKKADERETAREELQMLMVQNTNAAITLAEATAKAVQRIPDARCNGDMHKALSYAEQVKAKQKDFFQRRGIHALLEDE